MYGLQPGILLKIDLLLDFEQADEQGDELVYIAEEGAEFFGVVHVGQEQGVCESSEESTVARGKCFGVSLCCLWRVDISRVST